MWDAATWRRSKDDSARASSRWCLPLPLTAEAARLPPGAVPPPAPGARRAPGLWSVACGCTCLLLNLLWAVVMRCAAHHHRHVSSCRSRRVAPHATAARRALTLLLNCTTAVSTAGRLWRSGSPRSPTLDNGLCTGGSLQYGLLSFSQCTAACDSTSGCHAVSFYYGGGGYQGGSNTWPAVPGADCPTAATATSEASVRTAGYMLALLGCASLLLLGHCGATFCTAQAQQVLLSSGRCDLRTRVLDRGSHLWRRWALMFRLGVLLLLGKSQVVLALTFPAQASPTIAGGYQFCKKKMDVRT